MKLNPADMIDGSDRRIPFEPDLKCDICDRMGAYDFMGDYICPICLSVTEPCIENDDEEENS